MKSKGTLKLTAQKIVGAPYGELVRLFEKWVTAQGTLEAARNTIFTPQRTFWLFLDQVFTGDGTCREILRKYQAWRAVAGKKEISPNTGGYCQARARLSLGDIQAVNTQLVQRIEGEYPQQLWCGRSVVVVDGSSVSMPDTLENQERYPQPTSQKKGCGFPVMRIVVYFALSSGIILDMAKDALTVGETALSRRLWDMLQAGDVFLADRGFCSYADVHYLRERKVDCVLRNHQRRSVGVKPGKQLGNGDRLVYWTKSKVCPKWLDREAWDALPDTVLIREIKVVVATPGFRTENLTIVTTLLDPRLFPKEAFAQLYLQRWRAELFLRDIKISMNMDVLRCKTPDMVDKELYMHLIAYNLVRALMLQAAATRNIPPVRLSFKGAAVTVRQWAPIMAVAAQYGTDATKIYIAMLNAIARDPVPERPGRAEPRARKRRPKNYQLLTKPRKIFKECTHRNRYAKP